MAEAAPVLSLTGRRWIMPEPHDAVTGVALPSWVLAVLARRGISSHSEVQGFMSPSLANLADPASMADVGRALELLRRAITNSEPITVWGDYDVDGVCSTSMLVQFLESVGATVSYYVPDRRTEGYGLNATAVRELCSRTRLLVTADCGITANAEIALARELGCDVIVVDHHKVGDSLPPANANLDPHRPDCAFPFKDLCATGVAFMLVCALRRDLRERGLLQGRREPDVRDYLDLAAMATVADVVPLTGQNRILVAAGLRRIATTERCGLVALCNVAEVDRDKVTSEDLGYRIGPRINARGRLSHAAEAVELMLTTDPARARELAVALDAANRERRELEKATVSAAIEQVEGLRLDTHPALVVYDPSWHPGVLGLVATRLVSRYRLPAIVIGEAGKGSGRGIERLDLHAALCAASQHLVRFGGHAAAAGVTVQPEKVEELRTALGRAVEGQLGAPPYIPELRPDGALELDELSLAMMDGIDRLAPFGHHNPEPLWVTRGVPVVGRRVVGGDHLKLFVGAARHEAIGFNMAHLMDALPERVDLAYRLGRNCYNGEEKLQLELQDVRVA